jgi:hypothetical protein
MLTKIKYNEWIGNYEAYNPHLIIEHEHNGKYISYMVKVNGDIPNSSKIELDKLFEVISDCMNNSINKLIVDKP